MSVQQCYDGIVESCQKALRFFLPLSSSSSFSNIGVSGSFRFLLSVGKRRSNTVGRGPDCIKREDGHEGDRRVL